MSIIVSVSCKHNRDLLVQSKRMNFFKSRSYLTDPPSLSKIIIQIHVSLQKYYGQIVFSRSLRENGRRNEADASTVSPGRRSFIITLV